jgi:hypothetical protein
MDFNFGFNFQPVMQSAQHHFIINQNGFCNPQVMVMTTYHDQIYQQPSRPQPRLIAVTNNIQINQVVQKQPSNPNVRTIGVDTCRSMKCSVYHSKHHCDVCNDLDADHLSTECTKSKGMYYNPRVR